MLRKTLIALSLAAIVPMAQANDTDARIAQSRQTAGKLAQQLSGELKKQVEAGGPASAIPVCRDKAPAIASELSRQSGWRVTRVSLKPRNPMLGTPDEWEQGALKILEARLAAGEKPETLEFSQVVDEPSGRVFRYMKGLPVASMCTTCHGAPDLVLEEVKAKLAADYPHDKAMGYKPGMLRGGISIKQPM
jgi:cytochrome c553